MAALFLASDNACLRVATSVVTPRTPIAILSFFATTSFIYLHKALRTLALLELLLGKAELLLGPLKVLVQRVHLCSQCDRGQKQKTEYDIDIIMLDSCEYY